MHTFCTYRDDKTAQERVTRTSQYNSRARQDIIFFRGDNLARSDRLPHNVHRVFAPGFRLDPSPRSAAAVGVVLLFLVVVLVVVLLLSFQVSDTTPLLGQLLQSL